MNRRNLLKSIASLGIFGIIPSMGKSEEVVPEGWMHTKKIVNGRLRYNKIEKTIDDHKCPAKKVLFQGETFILSHFLVLHSVMGRITFVAAVYYTDGYGGLPHLKEYIDSINEGDALDYDAIYRDCPFEKTLWYEAMEARSDLEYGL